MAAMACRLAAHKQPPVVGREGRCVCGGRDSLPLKVSPLAADLLWCVRRVLESPPPRHVPPLHPSSTFLGYCLTPLPLPAWTREGVSKNKTPLPIRTLTLRVG